MSAETGERLARLEVRLELVEQRAGERHETLVGLLREQRAELGELRATVADHDRRFIRLGLALAGGGSVAGGALVGLVQAIMGLQ